MPAVLLCAHFTDQELTQRKQARTGARRTLPDPAATARALAKLVTPLACPSLFAGGGCGRSSRNRTR
jgi:hypothetical protein